MWHGSLTASIYGHAWHLRTACSCSPSSRTDHLHTVKPQVAFASLSPPAVMDIRRLRRRLLEVFSRHVRLRFSILASQRLVKPVLPPPIGRSSLCSRLTSPKGANVHNRWCSERSERNLRSPQVWDDRPRRGRT